MYDLVNSTTGEVRRYGSEALARFMLSRLGPDWQLFNLHGV